MRLPPQIILTALESSKISVLLGALDLNPDVGQKTVIITNSAQEVEDVFQVKECLSHFFIANIQKCVNILM